MSIHNSARALTSEFGAIVGAGNVLTDRAQLLPYVTDWRGRYVGNALCVVRPGNSAETAAVVRLCAQSNTPIVTQGGNTGLCGASVPDQTGSAIVLSMTRMRSVRALDLANNTICVEAGCVLAHVQQAAATAERLFPISLAAEGSCTIGGNIATNAGGVQVLRYGSMREQVLGLEVVLPDGRIWNGLRGLRKDNTGYDLKHVFIGAEGTLGVITAAVLKLYPRARQQVTAWASVANPADAVTLLQALREHVGERVTAFELVSHFCLELVLKHIPGVRDPLTDACSWYVLIELSDESNTTPLAAGLEHCLERAYEQQWVTNAAIAESGAQAQAMWSLREHISEAQRLEGANIKHDVSMPLSHIAAFIETGQQRVSQAFPGARLVVFGHVGDGNVHYNVSAPLGQDTRGFLASAPAVNRVVHDLVHEHGGSISAEHGIGQLKRDELPRYKSALELDLMRTLKRAWDPHNIMNPGKVL
jgi:FAD/FMN-containing dehydrogenase